MSAASDPSQYLNREPTALITQEVDFRGQSTNATILDFIGQESHYAASFGVQWKRYRQVQIDRFNGSTRSMDHLRMFTLDDVDALKGQTVLEIGSGAGRFTDLLVDLAKTVITVDPSPAISINAALGAPNLIPVRADLFDVPVRREAVDVVFCRGVTQHTESPRRAILKLFEYVKPGGLVMFDVYHLKWFTPFCTKYWLRPFTRNLGADSIIRAAEKWVPRLVHFKKHFVKPITGKSKLGVNLAAQMVPVADYDEAEDLGSEENRMMWAVLDTVDMYSPRYDKPMTYPAIMDALAEAGATDIKGNYSNFCFNARAPR